MVSDEEISKLEYGDVLDIIVAHYILTMNMESLSDLNKQTNVKKSLTVRTKLL